MSLVDWVLALHLIAAAAMLGAVTLFWVIAIGLRSVDTPGPTLAMTRVAAVGNRTVEVGALGTIVFGVWLALSLDAYEVWDGWIIASIVLWIVVAGLGQLSDLTKRAERARQLADAGQTEPNPELAALNRDGRALAIQLAATVALLAILVLMIWKPGA